MRSPRSRAKHLGVPERFAVDLAAIEEAAKRIEGLAHRTPVEICATLDRMAGRSLFLKCEQLQRIGAFKFRGACNAVRKLPAQLPGLDALVAPVADGLLTSLGELTWPVVRDLVDDIVPVTEEEIVLAMRLAWERAKQLIEPSAAVALAVAMGPALAGSHRVGVILSGGNVDLDRLPWS